VAENTPPDTHRVTPRTVEPDHSREGERDREHADERRGRSIRPEPERRESLGGDQAGVAGGGIDSTVSGLGSEKP
jgi:hypothetical protein